MSDSRIGCKKCIDADESCAECKSWCSGYAEGVKAAQVSTAKWLREQLPEEHHELAMIIEHGEHTPWAGTRDREQ